MGNRDALPAFIGIGSNLGDAEAYVARAWDELGRLPRTRLAARSSLYRSAPLYYTEQADFVNAVARLDTSLPALDLLDALLSIERRCGRQRRRPNGPRTLDLDLLLYGRQVITHGRLTVPHPGLAVRRFALEPLLELDPDCVIPGVGAAADCLERCLDQPLKKIA